MRGEMPGLALVLKTNCVCIFPKRVRKREGCVERRHPDMDQHIIRTI